LKQYAGFGALKCILNLLKELSDIAHWPNSEMEIFPLVTAICMPNILFREYAVTDFNG